MNADAGAVSPERLTGELRSENLPLADAQRIGILGDLHGDLGHTLIFAGAMSTGGVKALLVLGDWGFIWPSKSLGDESVDILVGHDAPLHVPALDSILAGMARHWPAEALACAAAGRTQFRRGLMQVRPRLSLSGHYHWHVDEQVTFDSGPSSFTTRVVVVVVVVVMDLAGRGRISQAILDVATLDVQYLHRDGAPVEISDDR